MALAVRGGLMLTLPPWLAVPLVVVVALAQVAVVFWCAWSVCRDVRARRARREAEWLACRALLEAREERLLADRQARRREALGLTPRNGRRS